VAETAPPIVEAVDLDPIAPWWHTVLFILILVGLAAGDALHIGRASAANAHRMATYIVSILFEWAMVGYVWLFGLRLRRKRMRDVIGGRWAKPSDFFRDVGVAFLFWLVVVAFLIAVQFSLGQNPEAKRAMKVLLPQTAAEMIVWIFVSITAGFTEEFLFRGYLQRQFLALTKSQYAAVALQAVAFGSAHIYQGWKGAVTITVYGALFGILAVMRRSLRPGMLQHALQDSFTGIAGSLLSKHGYM
jgi:uncharacterized protein